RSGDRAPRLPLMIEELLLAHLAIGRDALPEWPVQELLVRQRRWVDLGLEVKDLVTGLPGCAVGFLRSYGLQRRLVHGSSPYLVMGARPTTLISRPRSSWARGGS